MALVFGRHGIYDWQTWQDFMDRLKGKCTENHGFLLHVLYCIGFQTRFSLKSKSLGETGNGKMQDWIYKDMTWYDQPKLEVPQPKCPADMRKCSGETREAEASSIQLLGATPGNGRSPGLANFAGSGNPFFDILWLEHLHCASTKRKERWFRTSFQAWSLHISAYLCYIYMYRRC